jgi:hypothetical protein
MVALSMEAEVASHVHSRSVRLAQDRERKLTERGSGGPEEASHMHSGHCDDEDGPDSKTARRFLSARLGTLGASKILGGGLVNGSRGGIPCALKKRAARTRQGKEDDRARLRGSRGGISYAQRPLR